MALYILNKLDTLSNRIYAVKNPQAARLPTCNNLATTWLSQLTTLWFLNFIDHLDLVSNYYLHYPVISVAAYKFLLIANSYVD